MTKWTYSTTPAGHVVARNSDTERHFAIATTPNVTIAGNIAKALNTLTEAADADMSGLESAQAALDEYEAATGVTDDDVS